MAGSWRIKPIWQHPWHTSRARYPFPAQHVSAGGEGHSKAAYSFPAALGMAIGTKAPTIPGCHQPRCTLAAARQLAWQRISGSALGWGVRPRSSLLLPCFEDHWRRRWGFLPAAPAEHPSRESILAAADPCSRGVISAGCSPSSVWNPASAHWLQSLLRPRGAAGESGFLSGLGLGLGSAPALAEDDGWVFQGGCGRSFSVILLQHPYLATSFPAPRQSSV